MDELCDLKWKRRPAYTTIRDIIQGTSAEEVEHCFRAYSRELQGDSAGKVVINCDGKTLRGRVDHFADRSALQILSAYAASEQIILAHEEVATKTNEIPVVQQLIEQLGLRDAIFTLDALHCQKKRSRW